MRKEYDSYPTPLNIVQLIVKEFIDRQGDWDQSFNVWEPCAGDKRIAKEITSYTERAGRNCPKVHCTDIQGGCDFFSFKKAPWRDVVTNPPFKDIRQFIDRAFSIGVERMALVSSERLWACKKGREQFERHKPDLFCMMDFREDYLGKGGSPDRALAINIWDSPCADSCEFKILRKPVEGESC